MTFCHFKYKRQFGMSMIMLLGVGKPVKESSQIVVAACQQFTTGTVC